MSILDSPDTDLPTGNYLVRFSTEANTGSFFQNIRPITHGVAQAGLNAPADTTPQAGFRFTLHSFTDTDALATVSYTHLTLPTICSV